MMQLIEKMEHHLLDINCTYAKGTDSHRARTQEISNTIKEAKQLLETETSQLRKMYYLGFSEFGSEKNYPNEFDYHFSENFNK